MKSLILKLALFVGWILEKILSAIGNRWPLIAISIKESIAKSDTFKTVQHTSSSKKMTKIILSTPNSINLYRALTFSTKEPETLDWIDEFGGEGKIFFDVGANVGIYSLYYAKQYGEKVYAFECSIFNLRILGINIHANQLSDLITIIPFPLTDRVLHSFFNLSTIVEGGALSTFSEEFGHDGQPLNVNFRFKTIGVPLDLLFKSRILLDHPSLLKIDVDGIEHLILSGCKDVLRSTQLKTVLVEVDDEFDKLSSEVSEILHQNGFLLREKKHSKMFDVGDYSHSYNQIWVRDHE